MDATKEEGQNPEKLVKTITDFLDLEHRPEWTDLKIAEYLIEALNQRKHLKSDQVEKLKNEILLKVIKNKNSIRRILEWYEIFDKNKVISNKSWRDRKKLFFNRLIQDKPSVKNSKDIDIDKLLTCLEIFYAIGAHEIFKVNHRGKIMELLPKTAKRDTELNNAWLKLHCLRKTGGRKLRAEKIYADKIQATLKRKKIEEEQGNIVKKKKKRGGFLSRLLKKRSTKKEEGGKTIQDILQSRELIL